MNYFWRLRFTEGKRAVPRFPVSRPDATDVAATTAAARTAVTRLLIVLGLTNGLAVQDGEKLDDLCVKRIPTELMRRKARKAYIAAGRSLLDFELRTTFGVEPKGWHQRTYGDMRFKLPARVETFGDLVAYVVHGWRAS